jgi:hypothetical protein
MLDLREVRHWRFIRLILRRAPALRISENSNTAWAPVSKDGEVSWFETPRTRLSNEGRCKIAAPHHEAERDRKRIKLIGRALLVHQQRRRAEDHQHNEQRGWPAQQPAHGADRNAGERSKRKSLENAVDHAISCI